MLERVYKLNEIPEPAATPAEEARTWASAVTVDPATAAPDGASHTAPIPVPLPVQGVGGAGVSPGQSDGNTQDSMPGPLSWDSVIDGYTPQEGETWELVLPHGETMKIKSCKSATDYLLIVKRAKMIAETMRKGAIPEDWEPYKREPRETVEQASMLSDLIADPPCPFIKALKMARNAGALFLYINKAIDDHSVEVLGQGFRQEVTDLKNV